MPTNQTDDVSNLLIYRHTWDFKQLYGKLAFRKKEKLHGIMSYSQFYSYYFQLILGLLKMVRSQTKNLILLR